jgi:hypothetical protein
MRGYYINKLVKVKKGTGHRLQAIGIRYQVSGSRRKNQSFKPESCNLSPES